MEKQAEQHQKWWQQLKQHQVAIGVVVIVLVVVIALVIVGYLFDWTGFNGYNKVTLTHTISGTNAGTVTKTEEYQPGKGLWDWLQLLIIPAVLAVAGYVINVTVSRNEQEATKQRDKTEHDIALDNQREKALQDYIDKMSELLLQEKGLRDSAEEDEVRKIARVRTLTILRRLDAARNRTLLDFLFESDLIRRKADTDIIKLEGANLSKVELEGADLQEAKLEKANLFNAQLHEANLQEANLQEVNLSYANLTSADLNGTHLLKADLSGANLKDAKITEKQLNEVKSLKGTIMPDGKMYSNSSGAYLVGANLHEANLSGVDLSTADLSGANLSGANVSLTNLNGANLKGVIGITVEQLEEARSLQGATMPDGSIHP